MPRTLPKKLPVNAKEPPERATEIQAPEIVPVGGRVGAAVVMIAIVAFLSYQRIEHYFFEPRRSVDRPASVTESIQRTGRASTPTFAKRQPFESFRDCTACPEMVMLPAGTFLMGSPGTENRRRDNEGPQHEVTISQPFAIGKYEVTFDQYDIFAETTGREKPKNMCCRRAWKDHPVINVNWHDASAYCAWLGEGYRLPTEAEWEYAARSGTTTRYSFGNEISRDQAKLLFGGGSHMDEVGSFPPNSWGVHDMHGNVREWVSDWTGKYSATAMIDPQGPDKGTFRVVRGGSTYWGEFDVRAAYRDMAFPDSQNNVVGFRCAGAQGS